ncbi:hypothetical protein MCUN1_000073 [Malassezia cuniculi]|uniref:Amino acid transporter n=1 Tax=Malassezia cuniculi TaxID=948313 RepID=A0AAF0EQI7_9BASI|nr:hypothetical protein MCUN1_000073 [Malassezia cuniculi]
MLHAYSRGAEPRNSAESDNSTDFAFNDAILHLDPSQESDTAQGPPTGRLNVFDVLALTIGLQIGSGIFSSPGIVTTHTGSVGCSVLVWIASGLLAFTGASSFAELATAIPLNGGAQTYLQYALGPLWGFLYSWTAIVALKPSSGAIIATIFGEYVVRVCLYVIDGVDSENSNGFSTYGRDDLPVFAVKGTAFALVLLLFAIQVFSRKGSTSVQLAITVAKCIMLYSIPVIGIVHAATQGLPDDSKKALGSFAGLFKGSSTDPSRYALALYSGLWAYDGWDQCSFIAGEMRNAQRDVPRVIRTSAVFVTTSFVTTVVCYFLVLSPSQVAHTNTVALDFGAMSLGSVGAVVCAGFVAFSCLGALNGHAFTYSRLVCASGQEGFLPSVFGEHSVRFGTLVYASILSTVFILGFVLFGSGFAALVNFCGICTWFWYGMTALGLLVLRVKEPELERPYRTWIATPILFVAVSLFLLVMPIFAAPWEALAALVFIGAGIPIYVVTQPDARRLISSYVRWQPVASDEIELSGR